MHSASRTRRFQASLGGLFIVLGAGCAAPVDGTDTDTEALTARRPAPGALIQVDMRSTTGVLLDEIPAGEAREDAAEALLARGSSFWVDRAARQLRLTAYRLVFRGLYHDTSGGAAARGPLPLPPREVWNIALAGHPRRMRVGGHDVIGVEYTFRTHILTDTASPAQTEPDLSAIGGTTQESFEFPVDPELILQRTGYACMDENEYPLGSVFEENAYYFYDDTCAVETASTASCHLTRLPSESCVDAVTRHVGRVHATMRFTRVPWNAALASRVRVGTVTNPTGADLSVVTEDMQSEHRVLYRYFAPGACEQEEGVIGRLGWRRLLTFSATVRNDGAAAIHMGDVTDPTSPWQTSRVFEFSACHSHYHFSHYGAFDYNGSPGSKRAFCLEDTNRFHNDEFTPLLASHQSCRFQGITRGWGDEYQFGLPGQWVDITDVDASRPHDLTFDANPDHFLCEGTPALDAAGNLVFDPTTFTNASGQTVSRLRCDMPSTWHDANVGRISFSQATGSFVTEPCERGQVGPLRDCGLRAQRPLPSCTPGAQVRLRCEADGLQVLRVCERSEQLGVGVACTLGDSLANQIVGERDAVVTFTCPAVRDAAAPGTGGYSLYDGPVVPGQDAAPVRCTAL